MLQKKWAMLKKLENAVMEQWFNWNVLVIKASGLRVTLRLIHTLCINNWQQFTVNEMIKHQHYTLQYLTNNESKMWLCLCQWMWELVCVWHFAASTSHPAEGGHRHLPGNSSDYQQHQCLPSHCWCCAHHTGPSWHGQAHCGWQRYDCRVPLSVNVMPESKGFS